MRSTEKYDDDDDEEEEDSFTTQQLFSFAWQIAKGMVGINIAISKRDKLWRYFLVVTLDLNKKSFLNKQSKCLRWVLGASFIGNFKLP